MKPVEFDYYRPGGVDAALRLISEHREEAAILAGGMTLGPMLNMRLVRPRAVIDVSRIEPLQSIAIEGDRVVTGAGVVQSVALRSDVIARELPLLALALPWVGHFQTRNRGTLGGSVAHADPSAEIPLCLVTLRGCVVLRSRRRERRVAAREFFVDVLTTARQPDEIIVALEWPRAPEGAGCGFAEFAHRHGDFALAAAACQVRLSADGRIADAALGVGGVEHRPTTLTAEPILGCTVEEAAGYLCEQALAGLTPMDDRAVPGEYRLALAKELTSDAFAQAVRRARAGGLQA